MHEEHWRAIKRLSVPSFRGEVKVYLPTECTAYECDKFLKLIKLLKKRFGATEESSVEISQLDAI